MLVMNQTLKIMDGNVSQKKELYKSKWHIGISQTKEIKVLSA